MDRATFAAGTRTVGRSTSAIVRLAAAAAATAVSPPAGSTCAVAFLARVRARRFAAVLAGAELVASGAPVALSVAALAGWTVATRFPAARVRVLAGGFAADFAGGLLEAVLGASAAELAPDSLGALAEVLAPDLLGDLALAFLGGLATESPSDPPCAPPVASRVSSPTDDGSPCAATARGSSCPGAGTRQA